MSNYPQDKFTAPNLSGNWRYWGNSQTVTSSGVYSPIKKITGIVDFKQDNIFINYENKQLEIYRVGVMTPTIVCVNGKTDTVWSLQSVNTGEGTYSLDNMPYCYKNGKPTKMVSSGGFIESSDKGIVFYYYEKI